MKVYPNKLPDHLKKGHAPVYIVSGDEPLLVQESTDLIRQALKARGFAERDLFHAEGNFDWTGVLYSANSMSLFAEQKLIEIRMPSGKPGKDGGEALVELAGQLGDATVLLLVLPRVDAATQRSKWFKTIESAGVLVQVWPVEAKDLPRWLDGRFRQAGLKATREAVQMMAERIEGNLLAAVQEIERLKLVITDHQVDVQDVVEGVADSARFDVFKLIDAALAGDATRAARMTSGLQAEGVEILFVVSMLGRELRSLETMKSEIARGRSIRDAMKAGRVWEKRAPLVGRCLERHSLDTIRTLAVSLGTIDRMVKGLVPGDPWRELQTVMLGLAGVTTVARASSI